MTKKTANVALITAIASFLFFLNNEAAKDLEQTQEQNAKLNSQLESINNALNQFKDEESNLMKNLKDLYIQFETSNEQTNNKLKELESKINTNSNNIKKLQATNLKKKEQAKRSIDKNPINNINNTKASEVKDNLTGTPIKMKITFYGDFASENGGYASLDAQGNKLVAGTVASNAYSFGTKFTFNNQVFTVRDRGGSSLNNPNKLDIFVPRLKGESDLAYKKRLLEYGVKTVTAYKIN